MMVMIKTNSKGIRNISANPTLSLINKEIPFEQMNIF